MGEARRRKLASQIIERATGRRSEVITDPTKFISAFADVVLNRTDDAPTIAIGPIVWGIDPGSDTKHWYFVVASGDRAGVFRVDQFKINEDDLALTEECRGLLMMEFVQRRPIVINDFDDELRFAKFCEAIWPCDKTRGIRADVERERTEMRGSS